MFSKKFTKNVSIFLAVIFVLAFVAPVILSVLAADNQLGELENKLEELAKEQERLQDDIKNNESTKDSEVQKKSQLEQQINNLTSRIDVMDDMINEYSLEIEQKESESNVVQADIDYQTEMYMERMRQNQMKGGLTYLDVIFGSESLTDLLTQLDNVAAIAAYDENLIESLRVAKADILDIKASIEQSKVIQEELKNSAETDKGSLQTASVEAEQYIDELESDIDRLQALYKEAEAEEERLNEEMRQLLISLAPSDYVGGVMIWPTPGYSRVSSPFGMRTHPVTGVYKMHTGIDIAAAGGTQILAVGSGTVLKTGYSSAWGNYILIDHGGGIASFYAHLQSSAIVGEGTAVAKGQKIGLVGTTGLSTGNHLHFEIRINGDSVEPLDYISP